MNLICKWFRHNYQPNLESTDYTVNSIGDAVEKTENKYYEGCVCRWCGDFIQTGGDPLDVKNA